MLDTEDKVSPMRTQGLFVSTHWSVVLAAGLSETAVASDALEQLCRAYWYPLYVYTRRRGYDVEEAKDLTQEFFARLIEKRYLGAVEEGRGRFRYFLLAALKHFLSDEWDKSTARKRGGGVRFISLDEQQPEERYHLEPRDEQTPEKAFQRRWALTLLELTLRRLREEFQLAGKEAQFDQLKSFFTGDRDQDSYAEAAARLGMTEAAAKMTVTRMRQRYRALLRAEIANTLNDPSQVDAEMRELAAVLRG
jgi:RNA polymerase sigma-70 factor (ECF subfamily)